MKAITIRQPHAQLVAIGAKTIDYLGLDYFTVDLTPAEAALFAAITEEST